MAKLKLKTKKIKNKSKSSNFNEKIEKKFKKVQKLNSQF